MLNNALPSVHSVSFPSRMLESVRVLWVLDTKLIPTREAPVMHAWNFYRLSSIDSDLTPSYTRSADRYLRVWILAFHMDFFEQQKSITTYRMVKEKTGILKPDETIPLCYSISTLKFRARQLINFRNYISKNPEKASFFEKEQIKKLPEQIKMITSCIKTDWNRLQNLLADTDPVFLKTFLR